MSDCLDYSKTHRFSKLILDYQDQLQQLLPFYNRFPHPQNFKRQIKEKSKTYDSLCRVALVQTLEDQYEHYNLTKATKANIKLLKDDYTFTITTGHQLNLFTGPLYTFYKIISVLNSCKALKSEYP